MRRGNDVGGNPFPVRPITTIGSRGAIEIRKRAGSRVPSLKQLMEDTEEEEEEDEEKSKIDTWQDELGEEADDDSSIVVVNDGLKESGRVDASEDFRDRKRLVENTIEEDVEDAEVNAGFLPVKGQPGMFYKRHRLNPVDVYQRKM